SALRLLNGRPLCPGPKRWLHSPRALKLSRARLTSRASPKLTARVSAVRCVQACEMRSIHSVVERRFCRMLEARWAGRTDLGSPAPRRPMTSDRRELEASDGCEWGSARVEPFGFA